MLRIKCCPCFFKRYCLYGLQAQNGKNSAFLLLPSGCGLIMGEVNQSVFISQIGSNLNETEII